MLLQGTISHDPLLCTEMNYLLVTRGCLSMSMHCALPAYLDTALPAGTNKKPRDMPVTKIPRQHAKMSVPLLRLIIAIRHT